MSNPSGPHAVRPVHGNSAKGHGPFATRNFAAGEAIIEEDHILLPKTKRSFEDFLKVENGRSTKEIQLAVLSLTAQQRADFRALHYDDSLTPSKTSNKKRQNYVDMSRFWTNKFTYDWPNKSTDMFVFKNLSRANHSRVSNAHFYFGTQNEGAIRAIKSIANIQEITIDYLSCDDGGPGRIAGTETMNSDGQNQVWAATVRHAGTIQLTQPSMLNSWPLMIVKLIWKHGVRC